MAMNLLNQNIAQMAYQDPYFALGNMIGRYIANSYEERGKQKLDQSLRNPDGSLKWGDEPQQNQQGTQFNPNDFSFLRGDNNQGTEETQQQNLFQKYENPQPVTVSPMSVLNSMDNTGTDGSLTPGVRKAMERIIGTNTTVGTNTPPPIDDTTAAMQSYGTTPTKPFSVQDWEAKVWAEGRRQGRPDSQIQAVIDGMKPQAQAMEKKYTDENSSRLIDQITALDPTKQENYGTIMNNLMELERLDPDRAKIMLNSLPTGRNFYNTNVQNQQIDQKFQDSMKMAAQNLANTLKEKQYVNAMELDNWMTKANYTQQQKMEMMQYVADHPELGMQVGSDGSISRRSSWSTKPSSAEIEQAKADKIAKFNVTELADSLLSSSQSATPDDYEDLTDAVKKWEDYRHSDEYKLLPEDVQNRLYEYALAANAKREKVAGWNEQSAKYASGLSDARKKQFGI